MAMANERHTYAREHLQWAFEGAPSKASEYHLIDLNLRCFARRVETLLGARQCAREKTLPAWDIFHGNLRVEYHDPR